MEQYVTTIYSQRRDNLFDKACVTICFWFIANIRQIAQIHLRDNPTVLDKE